MAGVLAACRIAQLVRAGGFVLALPSVGCALTWIDPNGDRHVLGFVDVTVHAPAAPETFAGNVVDLTTIGVGAGRTAQGGYVAVGYYREVSAALRDDALVVGNPLDLLGEPTRVHGDLK